MLILALAPSVRPIFPLSLLEVEEEKEELGEGEVVVEEGVGDVLLDFAACVDVSGVVTGDTAF